MKYKCNDCVKCKVDMCQDTCPRGPRGPRGHEGNKGPKGRPGKTGPTGPVGPAIPYISSSLGKVKCTFPSEDHVAVTPNSTTSVNASISIGPKPNSIGFLSAQAPDNSPIGGNCRGKNAVDWQMSRTDANQVASGNQSVIGGGTSNKASVQFATVSGGNSNEATEVGSTIGGGKLNKAYVEYSTIGGGLANKARGVSSTIGGGNNNTTNANNSTISGGQFNIAAGGYSMIGGGKSNSALCDYSTISGGTNNLISMTQSYCSTIAGGNGNQIITKNQAKTAGSTISGGYSNQIIAINGAVIQSSTIGGGSYNKIYANNSIIASYSTIGGGYRNIASGNLSTVSGGGSNYFTFPGNTASGNLSTVSGGGGNTASDTGATVGGGARNIASGKYSTVSGGQNNTASGNYSWVGGKYAFVKSIHPGAFVWGADGADANTTNPVTSAAPNAVHFAGIRLAPVNKSALQVYVDTDGRLGTAPSALKYKENIKSLVMDLPEKLDALTELNPVQFSFRTDVDKTTEYGLIAEEVAELIPELVVYNKEGEIETVKYHLLIPLLLAEVIRLKKMVLLKMN